MNKRSSNCAICENSNRASICAVCVNNRLNECNTLLKSLKSRRDALFLKLTDVLVTKGKTDDQLNWRVLQNEKLVNLREKLRLSKEQLAQGMSQIEKRSYDLKAKYVVLESARSMLDKNRAEQLQKFYPNLICTQSLGHGSCSRIWQRDSYWNARPSSRSNEYPLFIPRQNYCSTSGEAWDKSSSNFGVASMESEKRPNLDCSRSGSFNYSAASPHSVETHKDLQKGISLLKKSVACITAYCYNSLCLDAPAEASTFEAFAKLLGTLSSSKEIRSVFSLKMACSRSCKQVQQLNKSVWNMNSAISSTTLLESAHMLPILLENFSDNNLPSSVASYLYATEISDVGKNESIIEGWDIVEHPTFPPPPSQTEDVEHWTRAMFIDATKK